MRIVFMGTPEFAVPCLEALVNNNFDVVAVITAPDKLGGRGMKNVIQSPVKKFAVSYGLKVLQPENLKKGSFLEIYRGLKPDINIVIAFRMLPEVVWNFPIFGTYNLHASLLPKYRGAAPINRAIMNGDNETGLTTFKLQHSIDTGSIAFQEKIEIFEDDNAGSLHNRMMEAGPELILKTINAIKEGNLILREQNDSEVSEAPKIFNEDCEINWNENNSKIYNFIRGLSPFPGAWTIMDGKTFKIIKAEKSGNDIYSDTGEITTDGKSYIHVNCSQGKLRLLEVQMQGKSKMDIKSFLNGYKPQNKKMG
jgi:methionyl-tRNA formyltransferase